MRRIPAIAIVLISAVPVGILATQKRDQAKTPPPKPLTLVGCVQRAETGDAYTLSEGKDSPTYKLTGSDVHDFVGQRIEITGSVAPKKLKIAGGLLPSPNVAAQAGAIDPVQAATATSGGVAGPGTVELPVFRVKSVRPVTGACEQ